MRFGREAACRVAVLVPMNGSAGIWGPSCISCAQLAIAEINRRGGIRGRPVEPVFLNSDDSAAGDLEVALNDLIEDEAIAGIVGMSVSSVRQRLNKLVSGRVPHVYTPLFEGNERSPNVFTIGETPTDQLVPAIRHLGAMLKVRRWALIGNDYVWPRASNAIAKQCIAASGGSVTFEGYVPFGIEEPAWLIERIVETRPDIVLLSLVGQDSVEFNRSFGALGLDRHIFRFSTAIEENILMATGADNTRRLFAAASYFSTLETERNQAFRERYHSLHQGVAPALNALGQSMYEGLNFFAALAGDAARDPRAPVAYESARGGVFHSNERKDNPTYLARADGLHFAIVDRLS
ncbi:substrate-binding domain-containing protein [Aquibium sp. A9E412]|uniref:substrate-binding domain-containing protein n=1 Tax=Aquibium sp. A9E412 TaxID=2976767 RepID=UPI0025B1AFE4|nr:substrate-binding domain-containing protein [Aquibium sp. A9E412]MDN2567979.1 substrate-binding domain-containing protein [Aquibium sp. A9E412]